ncbi:MAG TPA: RecX family transcriptional regulator [Clostridia bacterium]|nr:RecX family transcriptional regulator [Clostridia bacterium]
MIEKADWSNKGVKITLDGEEYLIHTKAYMEANLSEGQEVDLDALLLRSAYFYGLEKAESYLLRGLRTRKQLRDYLIAREFIDPVENILNFLEEYGLINDYDYAKTYYEQERHRRGSFAIKQRLRQRGINSSTLARIDMIEDPKDALELLLKKYSFWEDLDYKEEIKRKNFLLGRGFSHETINKAMILAKNKKTTNKD